MKEIDDRMIEKALRSLKRNRKSKLWSIIAGLGCMLVGGLLFQLAIRLSDVLSGQIDGSECIVLSAYIFQAGCFFFVGVFTLGKVFCGDSKDIILEYLAERYLREKNKPEEDSG